MPIQSFIERVTAAILAIFNIEAAVAYDVEDTTDPVTFMFTVANPMPNQADFVWPFEMNPILITASTIGGEEYRTSCTSGIINRVVSDLLNQWLAHQTARPIKQPIDRV